ncbi:MAG: hypothetical protein ACD_10C00616G0003 [uncultured bacterium]|nr:MAG: hypothetical protein ACD_10C00616G0003 [uncultured bacterium]
MTGDESQWNPAEGSVILELSAEGVTVHARQADIEQEHVGLFARQARLAFFGSGKGFDSAIGFKNRLQDIENKRVVVDHKNFEWIAHLILTELFFAD